MRYNFLKQPIIAVLGSHSALDVCRGAKDLGFKTLVVAEKGRDKTYSEYYKTQKVVPKKVIPGLTRNPLKLDSRMRWNDKLSIGCVDECIVLDKFSDILKPQIQKILKSKNCIFVPHRSFEVYINDYDAIEKKFRVPIFGNKFLLRIEERTEKINQYTLLTKAGITYPRRFQNPKDIDRLVIVKIQQKKVSFERGFFFAASCEEFKKEADRRIKAGFISQKNLDTAVIEEFVVGTPINFNFFYSPISQRLELIGTDTRRQTNLDGLLRLPAEQQKRVAKYVEITFKEMGHTAVTLPESLIEDTMKIGERFVFASQKLFPPGIIGPFALQALIRPVFPKLEIVVYDVSPRMPGSPGIAFTPYSGYLYSESLSMGKRVAMEIRQALQMNKLGSIVT